MDLESAERWIYTTYTVKTVVEEPGDPWI